MIYDISECCLLCYHPHGTTQPWTLGPDKEKNICMICLGTILEKHGQPRLTHELKALDKMEYGACHYCRSIANCYIMRLCHYHTHLDTSKMVNPIKFLDVDVHDLDGNYLSYFEDNVEKIKEYLLKIDKQLRIRRDSELFRKNKEAYDKAIEIGINNFKERCRNRLYMGQDEVKTVFQTDDPFTKLISIIEYIIKYPSSAKQKYEDNKESNDEFKQMICGVCGYFLLNHELERDYSLLKSNDVLHLLSELEKINSFEEFKEWGKKALFLSSEDSVDLQWMLSEIDIKNKIVCNWANGFSSAWTTHKQGFIYNKYK
jgi:hypothetical protein